ncbi:MAG TPA: nitroreductase [Thermodesulfobacteriota bacterium]
MDVLDAIRTRRSIAVYCADPVPKGKLRAILEAATWAPNHRHNEPWFFHVVEGEARARLADRLLEAARADAGGDKARGKVRTTAERIRNTPTVVFVQTFAAATPHDTEENYAAACCAVQNLLLAAHAEGLGAIWRTGVPCEHPVVKAFLGVPGDAKLVAAVFLGFPAAPAPPQTRRPLEERVRFLAE